MPTHRPPLFALALPLLLVLISGCKEGQTKSDGQTPPANGGGADPGAAAAKPGFKAETFGGVSFQYPAGWTSAPSEEGKGQMVTAPEPDAEWPASIALSVVDDPGSKDLQKAVDEAVVTLPNRRDKFLLKEKKVVQHPGGFQYGRVEYTSERGTVSLTQWEILSPMAGGKRLVVHANAASEDWPKYQPVFAEIVDSIRLPR